MPVFSARTSSTRLKNRPLLVRKSLVLACGLTYQTVSETRTVQISPNLSQPANNPMPRLFVAIDLPDAHKALLAALRDETLPARWTPPAQYHLTLRFIGEVDEARAATIEETLATVRAYAFSLQGRGLDVFPSMRKPSVMFAAIDPAPALLDLQARIEDALRPLSLDANAKPFHPHVTLARLRRTAPRTVRAFLHTHASFTLAPFEVTHFHLYESLLRPEGALHKRQAAFPLSEPNK